MAQNPGSSFLLRQGYGGQVTVRLRMTIVASALALTTPIHAGTIHTIAGGDDLTKREDGLPATEAATTFPQNVVVD